MNRCLVKSNTSEYVGIGHPDKIADQIADSIVDSAVNNDKYNQAAIEVLAAKDLIVVAGEITSKNNIDIKKIVSKNLKNLNYDPKNFEILEKIKIQSPEIRNSVVGKNKNICAGDQGIVFGFACDETKEFLPMSYVVARDLVKRIEDLIQEKKLLWAKYDMKSLVSMQIKNNVWIIDSLILSVQHNKNISQDEIKKQLKNEVIDFVVNKRENLSTEIKNLYINTSGSFVAGGLDSDTGVTNRKLIVDSYGTIARHGGGGYSGKDLSKVDRLGSYFARWVCKNLVSAGVCSWVELRCIYFLGAKHAVEYSITKNEDCSFDDEKIVKCIKEIFPQNIDEIIEFFIRKEINYFDLSTKGHFGRNDVILPWEELNKVKEIKAWFLKN